MTVFNRMWIYVLLFFIVLCLVGGCIDNRKVDSYLYPVYMEKKDKCGYIDKSGEIAIEPIFDEAYHFNEGLAVICKDGKYGYIDREGKVIISLKYDGAQKFSEGLAGVEVGKKWGYINYFSEFIINPKYSNVGYFSEGLAVVYESDQNNAYSFYYIDKTGKKILELSDKFHSGQKFSENLAGACTSYKCEFIDRGGKMLKTVQFERVSPFCMGLSCVSLGNKRGYINKAGEVIIPLKYEIGNDFSEGLAAVRLNNKVGYINNRDKVVIPFMYDYGANFKGGLAEVRDKKKKMTMYINKNNQVVWKGKGKRKNRYD